MPWGAAVGGAIALYGQSQAQDAQSDAANKAAEASKFTPYNVYSGFGSGTFDSGSPGTVGYWTGGGGTASGGWDRGGQINRLGAGGQGTWVPGQAARGPSATAALNPQYAALRDQYMKQAGSQMGAFSNYDPQQASADIYGKLSALSAPYEARARTDMESRLQAQGMLGSTGGGIQQQALFDSQGQSRIARELQSYSTAQDTLNQMQSRSINATNAASGLDSLALQNLNLGGAFGGKAMQGGQFGANIQNNAAMRAGDASAQFWSGIGQQVAPAIQGYAQNGNGYNPFAGSQYASSTGYDSLAGGGSFNYSGQG